jgi:uncharacterized protein (DUF1697 family)
VDAKAMTNLALLRGLNVGGKNTLAMKDLTGIFAAAGCREVRTYIQSGNVLFDAEPELAAEVPGRVAARIAETFGYRTPVVLRTGEQLADIVSRNPFLANGADPRSLHVLFLADVPSRGRIELLDPDRSPPDAFHVRGPEVFLHTPGGLARSKLTNAYFDSRLATTSTGRNWQTVTKLFALMNARTRA